MNTSNPATPPVLLGRSMQLVVQAMERRKQSTCPRGQARHSVEEYRLA